MVRSLQAAFITAVLALAATPVLGMTNLLTNPRFADSDGNGTCGDGWGNFGNTEFNTPFGRPSASLFADTGGNSGGVFQAGIVGSPGMTYQFDLLDVRIEPNWSAKLYFGLEYYAADDATKIGETVVLVNTALRVANGQVDGNVFSMTGRTLPGTVFVRPIIRFDSVNSSYAGQAQANAFVFDTYLSVAPGPGEEYLKNPGFEQTDGAGNPGYHWGTWGNAEVNELFGAGNAHASLYCDTIGNAGGIYQSSVLAAPTHGYRFALTNVRIEASFNADLFFGLEYYAEDNFTKLGETVRQISGVTGDGLRFEMVGTALPGTVYVRPVIRFNNVVSGGESSNVFVFEASLTEAMLINQRFEDLDINAQYGDYWGSFGNAGFNNFFGRPHASLFADTAGNWGGVFQTGIPCTPGTTYQFDLLDVRIEAQFSAKLYFGLEYYGADDSTKAGETIVLVDTASRISNGQVDGNVISMQSTAMDGAVYVRPIIRFDSVNESYSAHAQANAFIFDTCLSVAPTTGRQYLKNAGFETRNGSGKPGYYWSTWGAADFNAFFGAENAHASLYADQTANTGGVYQPSVLGIAGRPYHFSLLDVRIEQNFDGDLFYGLEYYGPDNYTKLGETAEQVPAAITGDRLAFDMTGTAVANTTYVRPFVRFGNVKTSGGTQRNVFIFAADLTELGGPGDLDGDGRVNDVDLALFVPCTTGPGIPYNPANPPDGCTLPVDSIGGIAADINGDRAVDMRDFGILQRCWSGTSPATVGCAE